MPKVRMVRHPPRRWPQTAERGAFRRANGMEAVWRGSSHPLVRRQSSAQVNLKTGKQTMQFAACNNLLKFLMKPVVLQVQPAKPNKASRSPIIRRYTAVQKRKRLFVLTLSESESSLCQRYRLKSQEVSQRRQNDAGALHCLGAESTSDEQGPPRVQLRSGGQTKSEGKNIRNGTC